MSKKDGSIGGWLRRLRQRLRYKLTGRLLCDTCRFDYRDACRRPQRPNAATCPDYKAK